MGKKEERPTDTTAPTWKGSLGCGLHTWGRKEELFNQLPAPGGDRWERNSCAPDSKDYVRRGPALTEKFSTPLTPPGNPNLQSSGPSDSRLLPNHGDSLVASDPDFLRGGKHKIQCQDPASVPILRNLQNGYFSGNDGRMGYKSKN